GIQSNRRARMGSKKGRPVCRLPFSVFCRSPAMTLATELPITAFSPVRPRGQNACRLPLLKTERLVLRRPSSGAVAAMVKFAGDGRVAENTARIPHPYSATDAERFLAEANRQSGGATFAVVLDGTMIGACGIELRPDEVELGYWIGVPFWNRG